MAAFKAILAELCSKLTPRTLRGRLQLWGVFLILVPSVFMTVTVAVYEFAEERNQAVRELEQNVSLQRRAVTMWAKNKATKIKMLAITDNVRSIDNKAMASDFESALKADNSFTNIIFINNSGKTEVDLKNPSGIDVSHKEYFKRALRGKPTIAEVIRLEKTGELRLIFAAPVHDYEGLFQGVVLGVMPFSTVDSVMGNFTMRRTDDTFLLDNTGMRFTLPRFVRGGETTKEGASCYLKTADSYAMQNALKGNSGVAAYDNCRGERVIGAYQWIGELNWAIIGEINESEVFEPIYNQIANMIIIFFIILLAVLPITIVMTKNIKKPIEFLLSGSESIKKLHYTYRIDDTKIIAAPYELRQLCTTFNQMADTINVHRSTLNEKIKKRTYALHNVVKRLSSETVARRKMELSLLQSEEKYRLLFNQATDAITLFAIEEDGRSGNFIEVNDKACELLGYSRDELLTLTPFDIDLNLKQGKTLYDEQLRQSDQNVMFDTICIDKSGNVIAVEVNVHLILLQGQPVKLSIIRDISMRRKLEQEMARLERLNLVGEMAASIGHEVRNPMTTVRGFLQMLGRKSENSHNAEYFKLMIDELDRANSIISEFLSLAKNKAVELKVQNLNSIIGSLYPLLQADAIITGKEVKLDLGEIPPLCLDEKEIRQLLLNLVRNGLEAMPSSTQLTISTFAEGEDVVLAVKDQGSGIPLDLLEKLGTPFFTTKETGTGLGLAVCYSIAHRHNAAIMPQTSPQGTTFYVRFKMSE